MKPTKKFMITCYIIIGIVMINIAIQHHFRKKIFSSNHKQIMFYIEKIESFKDNLRINPNEAVTKNDLADFTDMIFYQSQIDKLYMKNDLELAKGYQKVFPDYFLLILILWLSFQLDIIYRKINKKTEDNKSEAK